MVYIAAKTFQPEQMPEIIMAKKILSDKDLQDMPFEKAMAQLEEIVAKMEQDDLPLEDKFKYYELGHRLSRYCNEKLQSFEKRFEVLTKETAAGGEWQEFDPESGRRITTAPAAEDEDETSAENNPDSKQDNLLF